MNNARKIGKPVFLLALSLSLMLVIAACGGDDDSSESENVVNDDVDVEQVETAEQQPDEADAVESESADESAQTEPEQEEGEENALQQPSMQWNQPPEMQLVEGADYQAVVTTNRGQVTINLLQDEAPVTVNNFVFLAEQGFYSDVPFHRIISGFMIQTGDPTGTGAGGPGYRFEDEAVTREYTAGTVAMANAGPNTNGSQFFIVHGDLRNQLPPNYTIFGEVIDGMDVVDEIANVSVQPSRSGEMSSPTEEVKIESVEIRN